MSLYLAFHNEIKYHNRSKCDVTAQYDDEDDDNSV